MEERTKQNAFEIEMNRDLTTLSDYILLRDYEWLEFFYDEVVTPKEMEEIKQKYGKEIRKRTQKHPKTIKIS